MHACVRIPRPRRRRRRAVQALRAAVQVSWAAWAARAARPVQAARAARATRTARAEGLVLAQGWIGASARPLSSARARAVLPLLVTLAVSVRRKVGEDLCRGGKGEYVEGHAGARRVLLSAEPCPFDNPLHRQGWHCTLPHGLSSRLCPHRLWR